MYNNIMTYKNQAFNNRLFEYSMVKQEDRSKSELEVNSEKSNEGSELGEVLTRK